MGRPKKAESVIPIPLPEDSRLREDQYEVIVAAIRRVENDLSSIDRDLEHDRKDLQDFKVRLGTLEGEIKQLREAINLSAERTKDRVSDAVGPIEKEVSDLKEVINNKRVLSFRKKDNFITKFFKKKGG